MRRSFEAVLAHIRSAASRVSKDLCPQDKRPLLLRLETVMAFGVQMG